MNYIFKVQHQEEPNGTFYTRPLVTFLDNIPNLGKLGADIIFHDDVNDIDLIIASLEAQLSSINIEPYTWGYEIYSVICDSDFCRCHDNFDSTPERLADAELELPTKEVLQLMIEWRDFVIQWRIEYLGQDPSLFK